MGRPMLVLLYLALPALAILVQWAVPFERRIGWALASVASGMLLVVVAIALPHVTRDLLSPRVAGALGMLLLALAAAAPWLVFAGMKRTSRVVAARRLTGHA